MNQLAKVVIGALFTIVKLVRLSETEALIWYFDQAYLLKHINFSSLPSDGRSITLPADSVIKCSSNQLCKWQMSWSSDRPPRTTTRLFMRDDLRREDFQSYAKIESRFVFHLKELLVGAPSYSFEYQVPTAAEINIFGSQLETINNEDTYIVMKACSRIVCFDKNVHNAYPALYNVKLTVGNKTFSVQNNESVPYETIEDMVAFRWPTLVICTVSQKLHSILQGNDLVYMFHKYLYVAKASLEVKVIWNKANVSGWRSEYHPNDTFACSIIGTIRFTVLEYGLEECCKINNRRLEYAGKINVTTPPYRLLGVKGRVHFYCTVRWMDCGGIIKTNRDKVSLTYVSRRTCNEFPVGVMISTAQEPVIPMQEINCRPLACGMNWSFFMMASFQDIKIVSPNPSITIGWNMTPLSNFPTEYDGHVHVHCRISVAYDYNYSEKKRHVQKSKEFDFATPVTNINISHNTDQLLERGKWVICFGRGHPYPNLSWRIESSPSEELERGVEIMDSIFRMRDFSEPGLYIMVCKGENAFHINHSYITFIIEREFTFEVGHHDMYLYYILPVLTLFCIFCALVSLLSHVVKFHQHWYSSLRE